VSPNPFDAILMVAFGGPEGIADIRPFLANVLRGRRIPPARIEEVARHYELFDGKSPLTEITFRQAEGLRTGLSAAGIDLPVYVGMRNWHPLLADTLRVMSRDGIKRAIGVICAAHRSYSSCTQYRQNVLDARGEIVTAGVNDVEVTYVGDWHTHEGFIAANARHVETARQALPEAVRRAARIVFTAHSIPESMTGAAKYQAQLMESARLVADRLGSPDWTLVFQSRSGRPDDPWLGPDVGEYLRTAKAEGLAAAVLCPIGFVCDHIEVLYDLDHEAADICREIGLPMVRAEAVNADPAFLDTLRDAALDTWRRYAGGIPLSLVSPSAPERIEGPPPSRT
jgi:ferrochelatase